MPLYLLDTNIISDLIRNREGAGRRRLAALDAATNEVCTSVVVAAELRFGALKKGASALSRRVEASLASMPVHSLGGDVDRVYAEIRTALERAGQPIGANDLWIAAHALSMKAILVTDNTGEFSRIPNLQIENWIGDAVSR
ncbi:MAG: type II toxin-antitoxin system VapC family toxin [Desulfovibrionaceae bacterium]|nr:type II toxin-antitoxin system VapC family toxin [Desulfovibrionaceae bacterium]